MTFKSLAISVTYPDLFWAYQYPHQTHKGETMVSAKQRNFKMCASRYSKNTHWLGLFLDILGGAPNSVSVFLSIRPSVCLSVTHNISGTVHHLIIIFVTHA